MAVTKKPAPEARQRGKSCTSDILGANPNGHVKPKWAEHHKTLSMLRERYLGNRSAMYQSARETKVGASEDHIADAATDSYDRDWALAMISSDQNALYEIEQALGRIQEGTYGVCELTGRPIEAARLRAIPWTRFSARAQAELEARGTAKPRVTLGKLGALAGNGSEDEGAAEEGEELATAASQER